MTSTSITKAAEELLVLVADDDANTRSSLRRTLTTNGFRVIEAEDGAEAMKKLSAEVSVALFDLKMPKADGQQCLLYAREHFPETFIVIMSGMGKTDDVVKSMRRGAFWYLDKPFEKEDLLAIIGVAAELYSLKRQNTLIKDAFASSGPEQEIIAESSTMKTVLARAIKLSSLDATVLITGSSGTGKTTLARFVHQNGPRKDKPFVSVSCASIPRDLLESELFGHEKGAFTGANKARAGCIELANEGTLFLDEIGELPLELQPKLLTFLQDKRVRRLGGGSDRKFNVRIIAATNRNLPAMCAEGVFREDLYYRLNVLALHVPDLSSRREDILPLAERYLARISMSRKIPTYELTAGAKWALQNHPWAGNVRELENVLERTTAFSESKQLEQSDISFFQSTPPEARTQLPLVGRKLDEVERDVISETLALCGGHKAEAAAMLGISVKTIYNKIKKHGL